MSGRDEGFDRYLDDLILLVADRQTGHKVEPIELHLLHRANFPTAPPTWAQLAPAELERLGWVAPRTYTMRNLLLITGAGLKRAHEIREARRPKTWRERCRSVTRAEWIAIGALVVSILAWAVSIIALFQDKK